MLEGFGGIYGGGGPREFDGGHMLMWLCQMVYAKVILGEFVILVNHPTY